jgi:hypothetical protein
MIGRRKNGRPFKIEEFLPDWCKDKKSPQPMDPAEIEKMFAEFVTPSTTHG